MGLLLACVEASGGCGRTLGTHVPLESVSTIGKYRWSWSLATPTDTQKFSDEHDVPERVIWTAGRPLGNKVGRGAWVGTQDSWGSAFMPAECWCLAACDDEDTIPAADPIGSDTAARIIAAANPQCRK